MNLNGQPIRHRAFGCGVVKDLTDSTITVSFSSIEKKFLFPDAFKEHLTLQDEAMQKYIAGQILARETEVSRQRQIAQAEYERRQKLLNFPITANSHAVFDVPPEQLSQVRKTHRLSTGRYLSGYSKGQPRIAERLKPNSACLLTQRLRGNAEVQRQILGVCMVHEDFFGEDCSDGQVEAHPTHRLFLPSQPPLLFWEQFDAQAAPRWGNTAFKYCSGTVMNNMICKITQLLTGTDQQDDAEEFYRYFCKRNLLAPLIELSAPESEEAEEA